MGDVISMAEHLSNRRKSKAKSSPPPSDPAQLVLAASSVREAFDRRAMVHGDRERLTLAQNLWTILDLAVEKEPSLSRATILCESGQGQPHDSTKRLGYFAVDPNLPVEERTRKTKNLRRHVDRYVRIATTAAKLSGMNPDEFLVQLASGTDYEKPLRADEENPYDAALADILAILEGRFEQTEAHRATKNLASKYFGELWSRRLTISHEGDEVSGWARPDALAWGAITSRQAGGFIIDNAIKSSVPTAQIGSGFIAAVPGLVTMRVGDPAQEDIRVIVGDSKSPVPRGQEIELPTTINIYAQIELGLLPVGPKAAPQLVLLIKPHVLVSGWVSGVELTGVDVEKGVYGQPDWEYLALWERVEEDINPRIVATSAQFDCWSTIPCRPTLEMGKEAVDKGYIVDLCYRIDNGEGDLGQFRVLQLLNKSQWLVEPLTLPSMRKWLLIDMHDTDGDIIQTSLPKWFEEWFDGKSHLQEKLREMLNSLSESGKRAKQEVEDLKERLKAASEHAAALLASSVERQPVSCPEGTLAAALERGLVEGKKIHWGPDGPIMFWTTTFSGLLEASMILADNRRKALLE
jgi:hypothetical protein